MSHGSRSDSFPAMSTTVSVVSVGIGGRRHDAAMVAIREEVAGWEQRFSRFRPDSLLCEVNRASGSWSRVDSTYLDLLETCRAGVVATEGRFDPAMLPALEAQGYSRSLDDLPAIARAAKLDSPLVAGAAAWRAIELDRDNGRVKLPPGMRIDVGGIAKGALADVLADRYSDWPGGAISVGGDMRVWGVPPDGETWRVGVEHPLERENDIAQVDLHNRAWTAIATSSRAKRSWRTVNGSAHHLIDPVTGQPARSALLAVTVCAPTAADAEIVAKNLVIASGQEHASSSHLLGAFWALLIDDRLALDLVQREAA